MVPMLLDFLCDALMGFGEVRLGGVTSSMNMSAVLELWWRVCGLVAPVMTLGVSCKHV